MNFVTNTDLLTVITQDVLDEITGANSTLLDTAEDTAKSEVEENISAKYDTEAVFAATGNARNKSIIRIMVDLLLYHAHANLASHNIPELRQKRYDKAIKDLKDIRDGKSTPVGLPPLSTEPDSDETDNEGNPIPGGKWGIFSQKKFNSDY